MSIKVVNLSHVYAQNTVFEFHALKDINLDIENEKFIGIIGHTGSGKSTFIQHINRLLLPTSGTIFIDNVDITSKSVTTRQMCKKIGLVFQYPEYQLFEETIYKDIAFGPKNLGMSDSETQEVVKNAMETVGLDYENQKDLSPFDLSGGQKRRVAIAGVLAMKPEILILDEPASGLDPVGREDILGVFYKMSKEQNICILLVSHNMEDVADYAEKVVVFNKGEVIMYDTPQIVFANSKKLEEIGLTVPMGKKVLEMLSEKGINIDTTPYTTDLVASELIKYIND